VSHIRIYIPPGRGSVFISRRAAGPLSRWGSDNNFFPLTLGQRSPYRGTLSRWVSECSRPGSNLHRSIFFQLESTTFDVQCTEQGPCDLSSHNPQEPSTAAGHSEKKKTSRATGSNQTKPQLHSPIQHHEQTTGSQREEQVMHSMATIEQLRHSGVPEIRHTPCYALSSSKVLR
jgi:hypothetical protein